MSPRFSVVMPVFETAATVGAAVQSVLRQTERDLELIVIDDGSTDGSGDVAAAAGDERTRVLRQPNTGAAAARNAGIAAAAGEWVAFIDSDDLWLPTYLEAMSRRLGEAPDLALCYTDAWTLDPVSMRIGTATAMQWQRPPNPPPADPEAFLLELLQRNFIYSAAVVRRSVFDEIGGFDESLTAAIDYDMWLRLSASGHRAGRAPGLHAIYRRGRAGSISSNRPRTFANLLTVYTKIAERPDISPAARARARMRAAVAEKERAALEGRRGIDGVWRAHVRPALVRLRDVASGRDRWRAAPPSEVLEAFPSLAWSNQKAR